MSSRLAGFETLQNAGDACGWPRKRTRIHFLLEGFLTRLVVRMIRCVMHSFLIKPTIKNIDVCDVFDNGHLSLKGIKQ